MLPQTVLSVFANATILDHCVSIYVPSTLNVNQTVDNEKYVSLAKCALSKLFGAATIYPNCLGSWPSEHGQVDEKVDIVKSFCGLDDLVKHAADVKQIALQLKSDMGQESVAVEIDDELILV